MPDTIHSRRGKKGNNRKKNLNVFTLALGKGLFFQPKVGLHIITYFKPLPRPMKYQLHQCVSFEAEAVGAKVCFAMVSLYSASALSLDPRIREVHS